MPSQKSVVKKAGLLTAMKVRAQSLRDFLKDSTHGMKTVVLVQAAKDACMMSSER